MHTTSKFNNNYYSYIYSVEYHKSLFLAYICNTDFYISNDLYWKKLQYFFKNKREVIQFVLTCAKNLILYLVINLSQLSITYILFSELHTIKSYYYTEYLSTRLQQNTSHIKLYRITLYSKIKWIKYYLHIAYCFTYSKFSIIIWDLLTLKNLTLP